jgi:hypothetical protein
VRRRSRPDRVTERASAQAVDDRHRPETGHGGIVEIAIERLERLVHPGTAQVERRRHAPRPVQPE